ncbi:hypothetical protein M8C21_017492, partial [Ambrosia artemisiifolia]
MREPSCLMRSFSYNHTTHIPNNHVRMMEGNYAHAFEFMSDSSNVSKKCYVEEAKSYAQPGSVAEKKAFFDAFYKKLAAQKAAAAALLEQEKAAAEAAAAAAAAQQVTSKVVDLAIDNYIVDVDSKNIDSLNVKNLEVLKKERPLFKSKPNAVEEVRRPIIKKKPASSSWVASIHHRKDNISTPRTKNFTTNDDTDKRRLAAKTLKVLMNTSFVKESCRTTQSTKPTSSVNSTPKRAVTPVKTPAPASSISSTPKCVVTPMKTVGKPFVNGVNKQPSVTLSVNRRIETDAHSTVVGSKSTDPKWYNLSAVSQSLTAYKSKLKSPTISSPFEKAETEFRTMRESSYFKALPLPDFYNGRGTPEKILEAIRNRSHYEKHPR